MRRLSVVTKRRCGNCGSYGHREGRRCPIGGIAGGDREVEQAAKQVARMFPGRPDLVSLLEALQRNWIKGIHDGHASRRAHAAGG
jgi:hypothetical protein